MNYDLALIAKVLEDRNIAKAIRAGADRPGMLSAEAKAYWDILKEHHSRYHEIPTVEMFRTLAPTYHHVNVLDSIEAIVDNLKTTRLNAEMESVLTKIAKLNSDDPWEAKTELLRLVDTIAARHSKSNSYYIVGEDKDDTLALMKRLQEANGLLGYPWPWEYMNQNSIGVCNGNAFYIYGRQKSRKTFLVLYMALFYWSIGLKVLFFTREMSFEELKWRLIALMCNFNYMDCTKNNLPPGSAKKVEDALSEVFESGRFIISDIADGVSGFISAIEDIQPDIVFHDYFKAMADDAMGGKVNGEHRYVARAVDQMKSYISDKAKIPLFFVGHANREGDKSKGRSSTEHAWSDHITRRVDGAFRVTTDPNTNRMAFFLNAARSMEEGLGMTLNAKLCEGFGQMLGTDYSWIQNMSDDSKKESSPQKEPQATPGLPEEINIGSFT